MAGNSRRRGAVRRPGTKKGATRGSGGKGKRALSGKGPTPEASQRTGHPAASRRSQPGREQPAPGAQSRKEADASEVVTGRNAVLELARSGAPIERLELASGLRGDGRLAELLRIATARHIDVVEVARPDLDRLAGTASHQGVVATVPPYDYADPQDLLRRVTARGQVPLFVALDGITDPHNLGAVLRSAAAFGVHGLIVPQRRAAGMSPAVWKVSAGAATQVPVARASNLVQTLRACQREGCFVVGLAGEAPTTVTDLPVATEPLVLVVGSEGSGLSRLVRETCDVIAAIPISSRAESLNAAVSTGIALYEVAKQR